LVVSFCILLSGNQNSYIDEEQITQWPKEKVQRTNNDLQNIHIKLKIEAGMLNAWVWSFVNVTAKATCSRSPCVRVNGMFNALVWSFDFDLRDMSNIFGINTLLNNIDVQLSNN
jgi:hypothetical protein